MIILISNIILQIAVKDSLWDTLLKYISILIGEWNLGEYYLICCALLILSYFLFSKFKYYLPTLLITYAGLFIFYFISINYYYQEIKGWVNVGHADPLEFDEVFFSNLDTSIFFIIYNLIFIIVLSLYYKKKTKDI